MTLDMLRMRHEVSGTDTRLVEYLPYRVSH
jgi:hypothetical protein